jgi:tRNA threonylcarbamoyl adenosine modification protein (Sua5/YciO/YrdC/YwlC family)
MSEVVKLSGDQASDDAAISEVISTIQSGQLAVIPTDTSYAVIADAFHPGAVTLLRMAKQQSPNTPIPVAAASIEMAHGIAAMSNLATDLANVFWPGPLTLLTRSQPSLSWPISDHRTALSIRVPHSEIAQRIIKATGPVALTGAQLAGTDTIQIVEQAVNALGQKVAIYLDAGELSHNVSSVIDATTANLRLVRAGAISIGSIRAINPNVIDATNSN